jgi:methionyl-tRNA formyltransferase
MPGEVILLGKGDLAILIGEWFLASDYQLIAVVPTMPAPNWCASLPDWARTHSIPVVESGHYNDLPQMRDPSWRPALAFSVFYDKIIRPNFIDRCHRILNLHNGPLPRYRGVSPINWALKNAERHHGVTIHEITPGIDDGPIVAQVTFSIYPEFDEVIDVYRRALHFGWQLFQETMPLLVRIHPQPQDDSRALYYSGKQNPQLGDRRSFTRPQAPE